MKCCIALVSYFSPGSTDDPGKFLFLVQRTPIGRTSSHQGRSHHSAVERTQSPGESTRHMVTEVRTTSTLQRPHRVGEGLVERRTLLGGEASRVSARIDAGAKEDLVAEQIADPRNRRLVEQACLEGRPLTTCRGEHLIELCSGQRQGIGTELGEIRINLDTRQSPRVVKK